jgi:hypothetical protein
LDGMGRLGGLAVDRGMLSKSANGLANLPTSAAGEEQRTHEGQTTGGLQ